MIGDDLVGQLGSRLPNDHARQTLAQVAAASWCTQLDQPADQPLRVLDLGCGAGASIDFFRQIEPGVSWVGADISDSAEVRERTRADADFVTFNGTELPFADRSFDLVFSNQVFEHVRDPELLLGDVHRVLRAGGLLIGSTSQMEPFHSASFWNFSVPGFVTLLEDAGLETVEVRPGIDALTLILRRGLGAPAAFDRFWSKPSPLNRAIDLVARVRRAPPRWTNAAKLLFCGQFVFVARRP